MPHIQRGFLPPLIYPKEPINDTWTEIANTGNTVIKTQAEGMVMGRTATTGQNNKVPNFPSM